MKLITGLCTSIAILGLPFIASADFSGTLNLNCERRPLMPNHYTATIVGPTARGTYTMILTEKYYGMEMPKTYRLKRENSGSLKSSKAAVQWISESTEGMVVGVSTDEASNLELLCQ